MTATFANPEQVNPNMPSISERVRRNRMIALGVTAVAAMVAVTGPIRLVKDAVSPAYTGPAYTTTQLDNMPKFDYRLNPFEGTQAAASYVDPNAMAGHEPETRSDLMAYVDKEQGTGPNGTFIRGDVVKVPELPGEPAPKPQQ